MRGTFHAVAAVDLGNTRFPVTAGTFVFGGADVPIAVGCRISCRRLDVGEWVVLDDSNPSQLYGMLDDRRHSKWKWIPRFVPNDPILQRSKSFRVLDVRGTAARSTEFGVPPVGCAKQLWLVHGQVVSPSASELWRLQEWDADGAVGYAVAASLPSNAASALKICKTPGKGINKRVAAAVARRTLQRGALLSAVLAGTVQSFGTSREHALGNSMRLLRAPQRGGSRVPCRGCMDWRRAASASKQVPLCSAVGAR